MGAKGPKALMKRASPNILEEGEDHDDSAPDSPPKRQRTSTEDAAGKENAESRSVARLPAATSSPADGTMKPPECGVILSIECENFMCHRKFKLDFCRNVNFIFGK